MSEKEINEMLKKAITERICLFDEDTIYEKYKQIEKVYYYKIMTYNGYGISVYEASCYYGLSKLVDLKVDVKSIHLTSDMLDIIKKL